MINAKDQVNVSPHALLKSSNLLKEKQSQKKSGNASSVAHASTHVPTTPLNTAPVNPPHHIGFSMEKEPIEIYLVTSWPVDDIVQLYKAGGWWKDTYDKAGIPALIAGSYSFVVAIDKKTGKTVGMGRTISDGVSDAYIQDLVVLTSYRTKGIGKKIVQKLIDHCLSKGIVWIGLIAEPGSNQFYTSLGFTIMEHHIPMLFKREK
jgi:aralkylamine N-acetyltransferase